MKPPLAFILLACTMPPVFADNAWIPPSPQIGTVSTPTNSNRGTLRTIDLLTPKRTVVESLARSPVVVPKYDSRIINSNGTYLRRAVPTTDPRASTLSNTPWTRALP